MKSPPKQKSSSAMVLSPAAKSTSASVTSVSGRGSSAAGETATNSNNSMKSTPVSSSSSSGSSKVRCHVGLYVMLCTYRCPPPWYGWGFVQLVVQRMHPRGNILQSWQEAILISTKGSGDIMSLAV